MKVLSLFSGIGAFEKALTNLGINFETVGTSEIDKDAMVSYAAIHCGLDNKAIDNYDYPEPSLMADYLSARNIGYDFKENKPYDWQALAKRKNKRGIERYYLAAVLSKNLGDITKIDLDSLPDCDLITHGSPCQDFSVAGNGKGGDIGTETRSSLMWNSVEIIRRCKPRYVVWENVKNVLSKNHRHNFDKYIENLEEVGYKNYYKVLNAKDYGIPQNRERVFVISIRNDIEQEFEFPLPFDNGIRLKDLLEDVVDEKFYISNEKAEKLLLQLKDKQISNTVRSSGHGSVDRHTWDMVCVGNVNPSGKGMNGNVYAGDTAPTLTTNKGEGQKMCIPCLTPDREEKRQNGRRFKEDGEPMFTITGQDRHGVLQIGNYRDGLNFKNPQTGRVYSSNGISPTLNSMQGGDRQPKVMILDDTKSDAFGGGKLFENCPTLRASRYGHKVINTSTPYRIRKLTPLECFRLMGFSDEDFNKCVEVRISNSQLYKQAGNSIVVDVLEYIFERLLGDFR